MRDLRVRWHLVVLCALVTPRSSAAQQPVPPGATALCRDGTYSFSQHHQGTCSHHRGVAIWLDAGTTAATGTGQNAPASCGIHCGTERWLIKTLSDADTAHIHPDTVAATIEQLVAIHRPARLPPAGRAAPTELTIYRVDARLRALFSEADSDYHLVLASLQDSTVTMIAEVPDAKCSRVCGTPRAQLFTALRQKMMDYLDSPQSEPRPLIRVTGVGFFDYFHHQRGVATNAIELHPVLNVEFAAEPARADTTKRGSRR